MLSPEDALPATADPFAAARTRMIEGQIRPERVRHARLLAAMGAIGRERFVPPAQQSLAYRDGEVPVGPGRALMEPRVLARLLQALEPEPGERALVLEGGAGYSAAILARLGLDVTALDATDTVRAGGEAACASIGAEIRWTAGPLPPGERYDLVLIDGGVEHVPQAVADAVVPRTGRLGTVLLQPDQPGRAVIGEHTGRELRLRALFDAAASLLPGYAVPRRFRF